MSFRISRGITPEERVAKRLKVVVEDLDLDLEQVGVMIARVFPHLTFNRFQAMMESAAHEKEMIMNPQKRQESWRQYGLW